MNLAARAKHLQRTSLSNKKLKDEWENDRENDQFLGLPNWCYNLHGPSGSLEWRKCTCFSPKLCQDSQGKRCRFETLIRKSTSISWLVKSLTLPQPISSLSDKHTSCDWDWRGPSDFWFYQGFRFHQKRQQKTRRVASTINQRFRIKRKKHILPNETCQQKHNSDRSVKISTGSLYLPGQSEKTHSLRVGLRLSVFAGLRLSLLSSRSLFEVRQYKSLRLKL